ncbi:MAG: hypothetical protein ACI8S3_001174 [Alphaproteobacteria bacterium]|jgi:hypothetical protein
MRSAENTGNKRGLVLAPYADVADPIAKNSVPPQVIDTDRKATRE